MRVSPQTVSVLRVLKEDASSWSYGYDVSKATGIKSGTLYPILARLHDEGWLDARWMEAGAPGRPPRHVYRLTPMGSKEASRILSSSLQRKGSTKLAVES